MPKILIVDDHSITRLGITLILKEMFDNALIVEAFDESSAIHQLKRQAFDLMIFDLNMPGSDSAHLLSVSKELHPKMRTLVFSMHSEKTYAKHYFSRGADGFLNKEADNATIKKAIETVLAGHQYIPESLRATLSPGAKDLANSPTAKLSYREIEVLRRLLRGQSLTEIGSEMRLHVSTVSTYKTRIFQKLGVTSLLEIKDLQDLMN